MHASSREEKQVTEQISIRPEDNRHTAYQAGLEVQLNNILLQFPGQETPLFEQLNITLAPGEWHCLLGQSGCGKTTLLRLLAGLLPEDIHWQGSIKTNSKHPVKEHIAYMAQQDLLLPWLNVLENVCFGVRLKHGKASQLHQSRAIQLLERVGLKKYIHASPSQLSGGMRQRVALARTLMLDKPLVLMDEPFSALDAVTRYKLQDLAAELLEKRTVLLITHDPQEALRLGHSLYLMQGLPAKMTALPTPTGPIPREIDTTLVQCQQQILKALSLGNQHNV
ncbi:ABC transporter ATP-binding protein [Photobacterium galatheae]|nr:ABC transporter ATP-binding protein [Photobacterium galatheae]